MAETGIPGKGGTTTQTEQPMFSESTMDQYSDIDTGSGYYRNPYASGYGMGYQDPYASTRFMPASGLMGPTGFSPYRGGKGGFSSQPMYPSYGYSPYGGMSPGKGGYMPPYSPYPAPVATPEAPTTEGETEPSFGDPDVDLPVGFGVVGGDDFLPKPPFGAGDGSAVPERLRRRPINLDEWVARPPMFDQGGVSTQGPEDLARRGYYDIEDADPTQTIQGAAIAEDGSNVVDFTPYTGDEFVRIGDQVVSRAELQRRGSDYYTRPVQAPPMRRQQYPMYGGKGGYYR